MDFSGLCFSFCVRVKFWRLEDDKKKKKKKRGQLLRWMRTSGAASPESRHAPRPADQHGMILAYLGYCCSTTCLSTAVVVLFGLPDVVSVAYLSTSDVVSVAVLCLRLPQPPLSRFPASATACLATFVWINRRCVHDHRRQGVELEREKSRREFSSGVC